MKLLIVICLIMSLRSFATNAANFHDKMPVITCGVLGADSGDTSLEIGTESLNELGKFDYVTHDEITFTKQEKTYQVTAQLNAMMLKRNCDDKTTTFLGVLVLEVFRDEETILHNTIEVPLHLYTYFTLPGEVSLVCTTLD